MALGSKLRPRPAESEVDSTGPVQTQARFRRRRMGRRWRVVRRVLLAVLAVGLVAGLVWLVFFSSVLAVQGATVTGTQVLTRAQVEKAAEVTEGVPLLTADLDGVRARVEDLAAVRSAEVSRSWPNHVHISVTERSPVGAVLWEGSWRGFDEQGVLFRSYPKQPAGVPVVRVRASTSVDALAEAASVMRALPDAVAQRLAYADVRSIDGITLHLKGGTSVEWGSADESALKAKVLSLLMAQQKARVYNVTAPSQPTIQP